MSSSNITCPRAGYVWKYVGYFRGNETELARGDKTFPSRSAAIEEAMKTQFDFPSCYDVQLKIVRRICPALICKLEDIQN